MTANYIESVYTVSWDTLYCLIVLAIFTVAFIYTVFEYFSFYYTICECGVALFKRYIIKHKSVNVLCCSTIVSAVCKQFVVFAKTLIQ